MSKRKDVIRVGDRVKIINPTEFIRCGYPLTTDIIIENHITPEQKELMWKLLATAGYKQLYPLFTNATDYEYSKLERTFATILLKSKGWGGKERKIYTQYVDKYLNKIGIVHSKKCVKTGTYSPSRSSQGYYDSYPEYEPAYLENEKTVIIYDIAIPIYNGELFRDYVKFPHSAIQKIENEAIENTTDEF